MKTRHGWTVSAILLSALAAMQAQAQITFSEDFTGAGTVNDWYFFNGACLTAGTSTATANPGTIPSCSSVLQSYYVHAANADPYLLGGNSGYLGSSTAPASPASQVPDPVGSG